MKAAVGVLFPVYGREHLAKVSAQCLARIASELEDCAPFRVLVVGNEDWAEAMAKEYGWAYLIQSNSPLGAKFDAGARWIVDKWGNVCTHFMEWGADNIASKAFTELLRHRLTGPQVPCITTNAFYMIKEGTKEVRLFNLGKGSNIGRLTSMDVVKKIRSTAAGHLFDHDRKRGLDRSFRLKVQAVTGRFVKLHEIATPYLIDVKGRGSLNPWGPFESKPSKFPLVEIEGDFPELTKLIATWQPPENSEATRSTSTLTRSKERTPSTTPSRTTRGKSSPAQPAAPSAASSKPSTRRRKTRTARGKS